MVWANGLIPGLPGQLPGIVGRNLGRWDRVGPSGPGDMMLDHRLICLSFRSYLHLKL